MLDRIRHQLNRRAVETLERKPRRFALDRGVVSFCFDDFPKTAWTAGGPILARYNARGSYYFCAGHDGKVVEDVRQYDAADLNEVVAAGHELGCHTAHHARLTEIGVAAMEKEWAENAAFAAQRLPGHTLSTFAYPYGEVSLAAKQAAGARFNACRGVWAGHNVGAADLALLKCVCLVPHILSKKSAGEWVAEAAEMKSWLIFLTHDVEIAPSPYGVTPAALEAVVRSASEAGLDMLPVRDVLARVEAATAPE